MGVLAAAYLVRGINYDSWTSLLFASLLLGVFNAVLRPVLLLLSLPLLLLTLGLFTLVINALLLYFVGSLVEGFHVARFSSAFWGALIISLVSLVLNPILGVRKIEVAARHTQSSAASSRGQGAQGPVIDV